MSSENNKERTLVIDIGNTNIVCAEFLGNVIGKIHRLSSRPIPGVKELSAWFESLATAEFDRIAIACVVPDLGKKVLDILQRCASPVIFEISAFSNLGLSYKARDLAAIGADLVANALAAWKLYGGSNIIVDLGTATTIQIVSSEGLYAGVAIAAGLKSSADILAQNAARLQEQKLEIPKELMANNTRDAMLSGLMYGHAFMLEAFIQKTKELYHIYSPFRVILSGGLSPLLAPLLNGIDIIDNSLTLKGLCLAARILAEGGAKS